MGMYVLTCFRLQLPLCCRQETCRLLSDQSTPLLRPDEAVVLALPYLTFWPHCKGEAGCHVLLL